MSWHNLDEMTGLWRHDTQQNDIRLNNKRHSLMTLDAYAECRLCLVYLSIVILIEGEGSVQFTSLYLLVEIRLFWKYDLPLLQSKQPYWGGQLYWAFPFS